MRVAGLLALALAAITLPGVSHAQETLTVMSFNVRLPVASDGAHSWDKRRALAVATIERESPDLIGTQELWAVQGNYIVDRLPAYGWFGGDRRGGHADEHMGIFYRRDRLELIEVGDFWLSDTPTVPGSISWGNLYPRMVSWGLFETIAGGRRFLLVNTHFAYRDEDGPAREKMAAAVRAHVAARPADLPVIVTGDFNTGPASPPHAILTEMLADVWTAAPTRSGPEGTFHGFTGKPGERIDWILTRGFTPLSVRTVDRHRGALYPSDHFPVVARLGWAGG
jgi:endonuclease/exonuclease/phosphatase family metal-dependent hydrolase